MLLILTWKHERAKYYSYDVAVHFQKRFLNKQDSILEWTMRFAITHTHKFDAFEYYWFLVQRKIVWCIDVSLIEKSKSGEGVNIWVYLYNTKMCLIFLGWWRSPWPSNLLMLVRRWMLIFMHCRDCCGPLNKSKTKDKFIYFYIFLEEYGIKEYRNKNILLHNVHVFGIMLDQSTSHWEIVNTIFKYSVKNNSIRTYPQTHILVIFACKFTSLWDISVYEGRRGGCGNRIFSQIISHCRHNFSFFPHYSLSYINYFVASFSYSDAKVVSSPLLIF